MRPVQTGRVAHTLEIGPLEESWIRSEETLRAFKVVAVACLALGLTLSSTGCYSTSEHGKTSTERKQLEKKDYAGMGRKLEKVASLSTRPGDKARAYVGAGRAYLNGGVPEKALQLFLKARRAQPRGAQTRRVRQGIGEAHFALGDYYLASRYLAKGIPTQGTHDRERVLAKLVVCHQTLNHPTNDAVAYRKQLSKPFSYEVKEILSMDPVRDVSGRTARAAWHDPGEPNRRPDLKVQKRKKSRPSSRNRIVVRARDKWGARPLRRSNAVPMETPTRITIHHTADVFWSRYAQDTTAEIRRIQRLHQTNNRWADIGYHYVIDRNGQVWQGRELKYQGAHAGGQANRGNIGIVLLGNYVKQQVNEPQRRSLGLLVGKLCNFYRIQPHGIYTHGEIHGKTDCPGPALTRQVDRLRAQLRHNLLAYRR